MKKLLLAAVAFFFMCGIAQAQTWHNVNQFTCTWNVVTTDIDGDPLPVDGTLHYRLYLANADTDPTKISPVQVDDVTILESTITLNTKGRYFVGVQSVWIYTDNSELASEINWADEIADQDAVELWAIRHHVSPHTPKNLKR